MSQQLSLPMSKGHAHKAIPILQDQGGRAWRAVFAFSQATNHHDKHVACALLGKQKVYGGLAHRAGPWWAEKVKSAWLLPPLQTILLHSPQQGAGKQGAASPACVSGELVSI